jgi:hypothetical protein
MAIEPGRRLAADRRLIDLLAIYRHAQRTIIAQVREALRSGDVFKASERRAQLAAVLSTLDQLGFETDPMAREIIHGAFGEGADTAATQVAKLKVAPPEIPGAFTGVSTEAVQTLQDSILGRLEDARRTVGRQVADIYAREQRRSAMLAILGPEGSVRTASGGLQFRLLHDKGVRELAKRGGVGFVDRAGRRWQLDTYAEMATRTVVREAAVEGAKTRMLSHGVDLARVSRSPKPCEICRPWEGRLVSLDGGTGDYQGEAVADLSSLPNGGPPMHPRCTHSLAPVASRIDALRRELAAA